jgi:predicted ribonuclease YlaK
LAKENWKRSSNERSKETALGKPANLKKILKTLKRSSGELKERDKLRFTKLLSKETEARLKAAFVKLADKDFNSTDIVNIVFKPLSLPRYVRRCTYEHKTKWNKRTSGRPNDTSFRACMQADAKTDACVLYPKICDLY